jgi:hypothetical protein
MSRWFLPKIKTLDFLGLKSRQFSRQKHKARSINCCKEVGVGAAKAMSSVNKIQATNGYEM